MKYRVSVPGQNVVIAEKDKATYMQKHLDVEADSPADALWKFSRHCGLPMRNGQLVGGMQATIVQLPEEGAA